MTIHKPETASNKIHMPGKSAVDNSCVYPLAKLTKSLTTLQLMHSVLGLAMGLFLSGQAFAQVDKSEFFDFEEAKRIWTTVRTHAAYESYYSANCPAWPAMGTWESQYADDPKAARAALKNHPQGEKIKRCWDLKLVGSVKGYVEGGKECAEAAKYNIFTHHCDDVPDWRSPAQIKREQARQEVLKRELRK